ncbi:MAG: YjjG family noncanonical pyrimidine nucleotidase [Spirochaetales bacterium]|nr:YjjG family noncanonical pyrimidine nucleotidase [Spirochaetales bacterium]
MIRMILWDLDNTLLDPRPPERLAIRKCFRDLDLGECTDEMLDAYPAINNKWWTMCEKGEKTKDEILVGRFQEFLSVFGRPVDKAADFLADYMDSLGDNIFPIPGALETLRFLKGKVKQYILTNGVWASQRKKLCNSGIIDIVDDVFVSEDIGFEKPEKEIYDLVLDKLGCFDRSEVMMVGDSLTTDILGGNNAGILCCWFNPKHKKRPSDLRIDYEIDEIRQLLPILGY